MKNRTNKQTIIIKTILIFILVTVSLNSYSQDSDTIYFHRKSELLPNGKCLKKYLRIMNREDDSLYSIKDFYKTGEVQMTGNFKSPNQKIRTGEFLWFNKKGEIIFLNHYQYDLTNDTIKPYFLKKYPELNKSDSMQINYMEYYKRGHYCSGVMVNDNAYGIWIFRNKKMELSQSIEYSKNERNGNYVVYFDSKDKVNSSCYGDVFYVGQYRRNKKDGRWIFHNQDRTIYREIKYENGNKIEDIKY